MSSSQPYRSIPTEDRVSSIPDSILSHILSFLPTKDSVATSVLLKQWNPSWLLVLDLNFDSQTFKDYITFSHVVYLVIVSREITLPIRSFCLKFGKEYSINNINRFINAAIQRGIENLDIDRLEDVNGLTSSIFSCKTLTVLKLKNLFVKDDNYQVDLPLLKVLCIDIMRFSYQATITKFFLGCPVIEELRTKIAAFYLRKLNPETPNLMRTSIPSQYISLYFLSRGKKWMLGVLQHTPNLQHLTINQDIENEIYEYNWPEPHTVPKGFSSQLRTCLFIGFRGRKCDLQCAEYVMKYAKVLRSMTIRSASSINLNAKHEILRKLAVCPRGCKLIFD